jgi:GcrA cell cycle regulator
MRGVAWSGRRIGLLKQLWAAGRTATEIAALLRISRAAVLGKMFRLRLSPGRGAKSSKTKSDAALLGRRRRGRRYAEVQIKPAAPPKARGKTLFELTNDTCRFPIGNPGTAGFHFCGEDGADLENGRPYCERHAKRAYVRPAKKTADRTSRASGSSGVVTTQSPPTVPAERRQRLVSKVPGRRA